MGRHFAVFVRESGNARDAASQEPDLRRWADQEQALKIVWYRGFERLARAIQAGEVAALVVWRLECLALPVPRLAALVADLRARRVNLIALRDGINLLHSPAGDLLMTTLAGAAASEAAARARGVADARARGVRFGRPAGPGRRLKVRPEQEETIRRLKGEGRKIAAIAREVGMSRPTIYSVLRRAAARRQEV